MAFRVTLKRAMKLAAYLAVLIVLAGAIALYLGGGLLMTGLVFTILVVIVRVAPAYRVRLERQDDGWGRE